MCAGEHVCCLQSRKVIGATKAAHDALDTRLIYNPVPLTVWENILAMRKKQVSEGLTSWRPVTAQPGIILALAFCDALMLMSNSPRLSNILIVAVVFVHMIAMTGLRRPPL